MDDFSSHLTTPGNISVSHYTLYPLNNSENGLSTEASVTIIREAERYIRYKIAKWLDEYFTYILTAVAVLGNSMALLTICIMRPRTSTSMYIATLAVVDTLCLVCKLLTVHLVRFPSVPEQISCGLFFALFLFVQYAASWLIVIISLERFIAVWFPLKVSRLSTKRTALIFMLSGALLFAVISFWTFWVYHRVEDPSWGIICVQRIEFDRAMVVIRKIHPVVYIIVPFLVILVVNTLIIVGLRKARRLRQQVNANGDVERGRYRAPVKMTAMLLTTAIVFLVLELPMVILTLFRHYGGGDAKRFVEDYFFVELAQTMEDTNHAVNFFLYFYSGAKFRETFLSFIRRKSCRKQTHPRQLTWSSRMSSYKISHYRNNSVAGESLHLAETTH